MTTIEEVKARINLEDLVGEVFTLTGRGRLVTDSS